MAALGSCADPRIQDRSVGTPVTGGQAPGEGRPPPGPSAPGFTLPDAGTSGVAPPPAPAGESCAEEAHTAQLVPLDLLLLVDTSASMNQLVAARSKWLRAIDALQAFVRDPKSAGLGVGLQFFPYLTLERTCNTDADCGLTGSRPNFWCHANHICAGPDDPIATARSCDPAVPFLCRGPPCVPLGRCARSGLNCLDIGQPCAGGAGDACVAPSRTCQNLDSSGSCAAADYQNLVVPIAELPAATALLTGALVAKMPSGGTPMGPAAQGAIDHLRAHLAARPGRRAVLVLVSDGLPASCDLDNSIDAVAATLQAARSGSPSISSYIIGVIDETALGGSRASLERLAVAGGSGMPFILSTRPDLTQRFLEALSQIRGSALACEFNIPPPTRGQLDYTRVNVRVNGPAGPDPLLYVAGADRCDPARGGWHYDVDPASGTPTRILMCQASCNRLREGRDLSVELRFGCRSRTID
jgi:hypothetical protein